MWLVFGRLSFGFALIALTPSVLLVSDWNRRQSGTKRIPHVAILQQASQPIIDGGVQGMLAGLAESGFTDGQSLTIRRYNAEGDIATANAIAKEITSGQFDLVLTDMNMPNMNGIELIRALREMPNYRRTPILALTTEKEITKKHEGRSAGATAWMVKPFLPDRLAETIKQLLE